MDGRPSNEREFRPGRPSRRRAETGLESGASDQRPGNVGEPIIPRDPRHGRSADRAREGRQARTRSTAQRILAGEGFPVKRDEGGHERVGDRDQVPDMKLRHGQLKGHLPKIVLTVCILAVIEDRGAPRPVGHRPSIVPFESMSRGQRIRHREVRGRGGTRDRPQRKDFRPGDLERKNQTEDGKTPEPVQQRC